MASTDARPVPQKNVAYRVTFPIFDATGSLVTAAGSLDSEISKDGGTFTDCTNEATEIATSSGVYYLDLTNTEMNADTVAIIVKSTGGKTVALVMYPEEAGDIRVNVTAYNGTAATSSGGRPEVNVSHFGGSAGTFSGGRPEVNTTHAAGTAWNSGAIGSSTLAADTLTAAKIHSDVTTELQSGLATASALSSVASAITTIDGIVDDILVDTGTTLDGKLNTIDDFLDTEVAAILAAVDTEVAAIKAKTDNLPASPAAVSDIPSAASIATAVMGSTIEGSYDVTEMHRLFAAVLLGKASGLATTTATFRDTGDSKDRVVATVDASGNRSAVTLDAS